MSAELEKKFRELAGDMTDSDDHVANLTSWEIDFLEDIQDSDKPLTVAQGEKVLEIARRLGIA